MKRLLTLLLLAAMLSSCTTAHYRMGMTEDNFLSQNHSAVPESQTSGSSVYRLHYHTGSGEGTQFFYFTNGILVQVDRGVRKPDITIDQTIHQ